MARRIELDSACPKAKTDDLLVEDFGKEVLLYDTRKDRAHSLNESAYAIWKQCDGKHSIADLAHDIYKTLPRSEAETLIQLGLERLRRRGLLEDASGLKAFDLSRRQLLRKLVIGAAAAGLAAPTIASMVAPTPANAFSGLPNGTPCSSNSQCQSGFCAGAPMGMCAA